MYTTLEYNNLEVNVREDFYKRTEDNLHGCFSILPVSPWQDY